VRSAEICELAGVSYRMLDYWTRLGLFSGGTVGRGSGTVRQWDEVQAITVLAIGSAQGIAYKQNVVTYRWLEGQVRRWWDRDPSMSGAYLLITSAGTEVVSHFDGAFGDAWLVVALEPCATRVREYLASRLTAVASGQ